MPSNVHLEPDIDQVVIAFLEGAATAAELWMRSAVAFGATMTTLDFVESRLSRAASDSAAADFYYELAFNGPSLERRRAERIQAAFEEAAERAAREHLDEHELLRLQVDLVAAAALPPRRPNAMA